MTSVIMKQKMKMRRFRSTEVEKRHKQIKEINVVCCVDLLPVYSKTIDKTGRFNSKRIGFRLFFQ